MDSEICQVTEGERRTRRTRKEKGEHGSEIGQVTEGERRTRAVQASIRNSETNTRASKTPTIASVSVQNVRR